MAISVHSASWSTIWSALGPDAAELGPPGSRRNGSKLQSKLKELDGAKVPRVQADVQFWTDIRLLLDGADLGEQRIILRHFVQLLELKVADPTAKHGPNFLRLVLEVGPLDFGEGRSGHDPAPETPETGSC